MLPKLSVSVSSNALMMQHPVVIIDNGGSTIKAGLSIDPISQNRLIQNAVVRSKGDKRQYIGHEFSQCKDCVSLSWRLPLERGYLTDWDVQKAIWDGIFSKDVLAVDPKESSLLITEPPFNFISIQERYDQFVFEEYGFASYYRSTPAALIPHGDLFIDPSSSPSGSPQCSVIIDSGFSFTHVIPLLNYRPIWSAVRRIDIGGKLLTNHLAQLVSFRQWNMLDQTWIINRVKEECCYVPKSKSQFGFDLEICRASPKKNSIIQEYLLPDYSQNRPGRIRTPEDILTDSDQILTMENERFSIPELLFRPSDIGMEQGGLGEAVADSIGSLPEEVRGMFWANIGLVGGNTKFGGFDERLLNELRPLAPAQYEIELYKEEDPVLSAYTSAHALSNTSRFDSMLLTRAEYNEAGSNAAWRKFGDWRKPVADWPFTYSTVTSGSFVNSDTERGKVGVNYGKIEMIEGAMGDGEIRGTRIMAEGAIGEDENEGAEDVNEGGSLADTAGSISIGAGARAGTGTRRRRSMSVRGRGLGLGRGASRGRGKSGVNAASASIRRSKSTTGGGEGSGAGSTSRGSATVASGSGSRRRGGRFRDRKAE